MVVNIAETLSEVAQRQADKIGIIEARTNAQLSFSELNSGAARYASFFKSKGVCAGDRVMLMVKPSADFISLTFALFRLGAPVILIDPGMGYRNLLTCIQSVKPDYLVGIPQAVLLSVLFRKTFKSLKKRFCVGSFFGLPGYDISRHAAQAAPELQLFSPEEDSLAAIIFTTGSTGPPKGVRFEHTIFAAQLELIKRQYRLCSEDVDQPGFPLFALFSTALGACAVIPDMDPTKPALVDAAAFVNSINRYGVTYSFGSPAIWRAVAAYCSKSERNCPSLRKVLMAGAPVSGSLVEQVFKIMPPGAEIHTPYGATESLPIVSIEGREIVEETWHDTIAGKGTCVGRPLSGINVKVIETADKPYNNFDQCREAAPYEIGEIIVKGPVVTRAYDNNEAENSFSKIPDTEGFWHRVGDVGYFDDAGRLWFCGRKAHRVKTAKGYMYTIPCEAIFNTHPAVFRSALVGIDNDDGFETPAIIIEKRKETETDDETIVREIKEIAGSHELTKTIKIALIHPSFPVDIRHNAKIFREKLKIWAQDKVVNT